MTRFVVVGTLRGPVDPPEPLDEQGQVKALVSWGQERQADARVVWLGQRERERIEARLKMLRTPRGRRILEGLAS